MLIESADEIKRPISTMAKKAPLFNESASGKKYIAGFDLFHLCDSLQKMKTIAKNLDILTFCGTSKATKINLTEALRGAFIEILSNLE